MEHVVVERVYAEPVTVEQIHESVQRGESCRTMHREARLAEVFRKAGFSHFRRAAETPFNLIFEARR